MKQTRRFSTPVVAAILGIVILILYGRSLPYPLLVGDDHFNINYNPFFHPLSPLTFARAWSEPYLNLFIPVTMSAWAALLVLALKIPSIPLPVFLHGTNLALHGVNSVLVFLLLRDVLKARGGEGTDEGASTTVAALLGAVLFAIHPLQVKNVAWVTGLKDLLGSFFGLLTLRAMLRADVGVHIVDGAVSLTGRSFRAYLWATVFFVLSILAKPTTVTLPVLAIVLSAAAGRDWRGSLIPVAPWLVPVGVLSWLTSRWEGAFNPELASALWLRPFGAIDNLAFYAQKVLVPHPLVFEMTRHAASRVGSALFWIEIAAILAVAALVWRARKRFPLVAIGLLFAVVALSPVLGLIPYAHQSISEVATHYCYLPLLGIALAFAAVASRLTFSRGAIGLAVLGLAAYAAVTAVQVGDYSSSQNLLEPVAEREPGNFFAHSNLAMSWLQSGELAKAIPEARYALELKPDSPIALERYAGTLFMAGPGRLRDAALDLLARRTQAHPRDARLRFERGHLLIMAGQAPSGITEIERALQLDPRLRRESSAIGDDIVHYYANHAELRPGLAVALKRFPDLESLNYIASVVGDH